MEKPTLADLQDLHYFDRSELAQRAGVAISVIQRMLTSEPVHRYQAELVLAALSDDFGKQYTLDSVQVALFSEEQEEGR